MEERVQRILTIVAGTSLLMALALLLILLGPAG